MLPKLKKRMWLIIVGVLVAGGAIAWVSVSPPIDGEYAEDHAELPRIAFDGSRATISGFRNFGYSPTGESIPRYEIRDFDLDDVETVWYVLVPFSTDWRGPAHSFLSFGFSDSTYVSISVEARREQGEEYSMLGGLLHRFEVIYVVGEERDLLGVRAVHREDDVYLYPIRATKEAIQTLFREMLEAANTLNSEPEFYNTLFNNCTTKILDHVNRVSPRPIRFGPRVLLPGYSDRIAYNHELLDTELTLEEARERFRVTERARTHWEDPEFSKLIRRSP